MASQWYSLVSQKLFLANKLLEITAEEVTASGSSTPAQKLRHEAATQGSIELLLRAKELLLVMIARFYQKRPQGTLSSLTELTHLIGSEAVEIERLAALEQDNGSWWSHLNQLEVAQHSPPATQKTVSAENIIAVSAENGPDRSIQALKKTLQAIKQFTDNLEAQHGEW